MRYSYKPVLLLCFCIIVINGCNRNRTSENVQMDMNAKPFENISEYGFFKDARDFTKPNEGVMSYKMVNTMFNDFSLRENFIYVPRGHACDFDSMNLLNPPVGSCLINVVYYWKDERTPSLGRQLIETQLLMR